MPKVSLVMPVFNTRRYVGEAVASVLAQRWRDWELIVWDDGSDDGAGDAARHAAGDDPRIRLFRSDANHGTTYTLNQAFAKAQGTYFGVIDSDDRLHPDALRQTVAHLDRRPKIGLVYTRYRVMDERGNPGLVGTRCRISYDPNRLLLDFMVYHFRLFRRRWFEHVGGFDESYRYAQDYEFCLRMSEVTPIRQVPRVLYDYRVHDRSVSLSRRSEQRECARLAIDAALVRRGMANHFHVEVDDQGTFRLRKRC